MADPTLVVGTGDGGKPSYMTSMLSEIVRVLTYTELASCIAVVVIGVFRGTPPERLPVYLAPIIGICAPFQSAYLAVRKVNGEVKPEEPKP